MPRRHEQRDRAMPARSFALLRMTQCFTTIPRPQTTRLPAYPPTPLAAYASICLAASPDSAFLLLCSHQAWSWIRADGSPTASDTGSTSSR